MTVYECINAVSAEIATTGIAKGRTNKQQNYQFRGVDDVYNALAPILSKHKLVILPRFIDRVCVERVAQSGSPLFNVTVEGEFDFVSAVDGSKHTTRAFGEAMDSADKATNKAMSAAYKYTAFQTFCIPTEGDNDADAETPQVAASEHDGGAQAAPRATPARRQPPPLTPPQKKAVASGQGSTLLISEPQQKRLYAIAKNAGWQDADLKAYMNEVWGYQSSKQVPRSQYDEICEAVKGGPIENVGGYA